MPEEPTHDDHAGDPQPVLAGRHRHVLREHEPGDQRRSRRPDTRTERELHRGEEIFGALGGDEVAAAAGQEMLYKQPYLEGLWYPIIIS